MGGDVPLVVDVEFVAVVVGVVGDGVVATGPSRALPLGGAWLDLVVSTEGGDHKDVGIILIRSKST